MVDFNKIANALAALHDTDADPNQIDSLIDMAVQLDEDDNAPLSLGENFFSLANWLADYMDDDLRETIEAAEIFFMTQDA